jgi:hypothetical protein
MFPVPPYKYQSSSELLNEAAGQSAAFYPVGSRQVRYQEF